ncbi:hypothetical protein [Philodulcilactobacillus myokoensis]|nr:hypothetical protein [Philodulcilactobacillus myokoensis]
MKKIWEWIKTIFFLIIAVGIFAAILAIFRAPTDGFSSLRELWDNFGF